MRRGGRPTDPLVRRPHRATRLGGPDRPTHLHPPRRRLTGLELPTDRPTHEPFCYAKLTFNFASPHLWLLGGLTCSLFTVHFTPPSVSRGRGVHCSWARCLVACAMCQRWATLDGSCSDLAHEACAQSRPRRDRRRRWPTRCLRAGRRCAPRPSPSGLFGKCGGWTGEGEEGEIRGEIVEEGVNRLSTQPCQLVSLLLVRVK